MSQMLWRWLAITMIAAGIITSVLVKWLIDDAVEEALEKQISLLKNGIDERLDLFDGLLVVDEPLMQQRLEGALPEISDILVSNKSDPVDWTSADLKLLLQHYRLDELRILDSSRKVVATSYKPDLEFDSDVLLSKDKVYLQNILLQKNVVFHDRFSLSPRTGSINIRAYYAPVNSDIIVEASLEVMPFLSELRSKRYTDFIFNGLFQNRIGNQLFSTRIDLFVINDVSATALDGRIIPLPRSHLPVLSSGQVYSTTLGNIKTYYFNVDLSGLIATKSLQKIIVRSQFDLSAPNAMAHNLIFGIILVIALIGLLICLLINLILRTKIVYRVQEVNNTLESITEGQYERQCSVTGDDEIRLIADHVNTLATTLAEREKQLLLAHNTLEERVLERTRELQNEVKKRRNAEDELNQLATTDPLTGLPNRRLIDDYLKRVLLSAKRTKLLTAILFLDLDNFKFINDTMGHGAGDQLLQAIAGRLTSAIRGSDIAGRWGGDEFIILLPDLEGDRRIVTRHVRTVVEKILKLVRADVPLQDFDHQCTVSIGITISEDDSTPESMFREADLAMYKAKEQGKNNYCFYEQVLQDVASARLEIEKELRIALRMKQFSLQFQPQVNAKKELVGAEALVRWKKTDGSFVPPGTFITVAKESGLIHQIGQFVLEACCEQYRCWLAEGLNLPKLSINVSNKQLEQAQFVEKLVEVVERNDLMPGQICLEIADSEIWDSHGQMIKNMNVLHEHGFLISVDDFGTGFSSLNKLKKLSIDQLKIDRSFVNGISFDANNAAIISLMISIASHLGVELIAEGVETELEHEQLLAKGCRMFQGYLYSKPLRPNEFASYVKKMQATNQLPTSLN